MLSLLANKKYLILAVAVVIVVFSVCVRGCIRNHKIEKLNQQIEQMNETINLQKQQINEANTRLKLAQAELESVRQYTERVETIQQESEVLKDEIYKTVCTDEESKDWYNARIPDSIVDVLNDWMCETSNRDAD